MDLAATVAAAAAAAAAAENGGGGGRRHSHGRRCGGGGGRHNQGKRGSSASCHAVEAGSFKEEFFRHGPLGMFLVVPAVNVRQSTVSRNCTLWSFPDFRGTSALYIESREIHRWSMDAPVVRRGGGKSLFPVR